MKYKLGELIDTISDTRKIEKNKVVLINTSDVLNGKVLNHSYTSNNNLKGQFKKRFQKNDILYSEIRPGNRRFAYVDFDSNDYIASTKLMVLRNKGGIVDNNFLYLILSNKKFTDDLQFIAEQRSGTFPQITFTELSNIEVDIPDLETQKKIVHILSVLDQKVELNNQESKRLHKIIKALYKNIAASINTKTKLAALAKISSGKRPTSIEANGNFSVVGARDVMGFTNNYNQEPETIITGRVGTLGVIKRYPRKIWASDNTLIVDTKYKNYVECYLSSVDFNAYNRGSTQPLITQTDLNNFIIPFNEKECGSFENKTTPLRNKIFVIEKQNEELVLLRNTLLPKLMSGKIKLDKDILK